MKLLILAAAAFALFIVLDLVWFQFMGKFFVNEVGSIARLTAEGAWNVRLLPAVFAYMLMAAGVVLFVFPQSNSLGAALLFGGIYGFIGFGLYDLTNLATLEAWTLRLAIVDMAWGTFVTAVVSAAVYGLRHIV